jgi:hypothetical protein
LGASIDQLAKTEKTHLGTEIEIELKKRLNLPEGDVLDTKIQGHDIDIKFSISENWMIPKEAVEKICIVVSADDDKSKFSFGVVRATTDKLSPSANRDKKRTFSAQHKKLIRWIVRDGDLKENFLLHLDEATRAEVLDQDKPGPPNVKKGQKRVRTLFRKVKEKIVPRTVIVVLGYQLDPLKRTRDAKKTLAKEGITVVCGTYKKDRAVAAARGFKIGPGEFVSFDTDPEVKQSTARP